MKKAMSTRGGNIITHTIATFHSSILFNIYKILVAHHVGVFIITELKYAVDFWNC